MLFGRSRLRLATPIVLTVVTVAAVLFALGVGTDDDVTSGIAGDVSSVVVDDQSDVLASAFEPSTPDMGIVPEVSADFEPDSSLVNTGASSDAFSEEPGSWTTFDAVEETGKDNFAYPTNDHYVAQFLRANADARYWDIDADSRQIRSLAVPAAPDDAIRLPAPSGGNDTSAVSAVLNANPGGNFVGQGTYRIAGLKLDDSGTRIWDMPMVPHSSTGRFVDVTADDVRVYSSPIDAQKQGSAGTGWYVTGDDFHLIDSGYRNMLNKSGDSSAGVVLKGGASGYHLAGNTFDHIVNASGGGETHRANPFWILGGEGDVKSGGGYIVNNKASRSQSNGKLVDADFLTVQSHDGGYEALVKVFGNETVDGGKRAVKAQTSGILVLSNKFEWREADGPLGRFTRLHMFSAQTGFDDTFIVQNNEVIVSGNRNWTTIFNIGRQKTNGTWTNLHYDNNYVQIDDKPPAGQGFDQVVLMGKSCKQGLATNNTSMEPTNSSFSNNKIVGTGAAIYFYMFGNGWDRAAGTFDTSGNDFSIDYTKAVDKRDETQSSHC